MSIQAISAGTNTYNAPKMKKVNFGDAQAASQPESAPKKKEKKGGWGYSIASGFLPGLGQFCQGRTADGFKQLGSCLGLGMLSATAYMLAMNAKNKYAQIAGIAAGVVAGLSNLGVGIYSMVDAYKGGKKD